MSGPVRPRPTRDEVNVRVAPSSMVETASPPRDGPRCAHGAVAGDWCSPCGGAVKATIGQVHAAFARGELTPAQAADEVIALRRDRSAHLWAWGFLVICILALGALMYGLGEPVRATAVEGRR